MLSASTSGHQKDPAQGEHGNLEKEIRGGEWSSSRRARARATADGTWRAKYGRGGPGFANRNRWFVEQQWTCFMHPAGISGGRCNQLGRACFRVCMFMYRRGICPASCGMRLCAAACGCAWAKAEQMRSQRSRAHVGSVEKCEQERERVRLGCHSAHHACRWNGHRCGCVNAACER
jgi:hypothetical protein